jgi:large subunit ribosomal protein L31
VKEKIHPKYEAVKFQCACGNVIETRSTKKGVVKIDLCSGCHPFFTGKEKLVDSAGRVEKFMRKYKDRYPEAAAKNAKKS